MLSRKVVSRNGCQLNECSNSVRLFLCSLAYFSPPQIKAKLSGSALSPIFSLMTSKTKLYAIFVSKRSYVGCRLKTMLVNLLKLRARRVWQRCGTYEICQWSRFHRFLMRNIAKVWNDEDTLRSICSLHHPQQFPRRHHLAKLRP